MNETLEKEIQDMTPLLVKWRRDFHRYPEVAFQEHKTSKKIRGFLEDLGLEVTVMAGTGLKAVLKGELSGPTVALRADLDALPLQEKSDKKNNKSNCGNFHAAILLVRIFDPTAPVLYTCLYPKYSFRYKGSQRFI